MTKNQGTGFTKSGGGGWWDRRIEGWTGGCFECQLRVPQHVTNTHDKLVDAVGGREGGREG